jgi:CTP synthase (UTP-ammonia lyase)
LTPDHGGRSARLFPRQRGDAGSSPPRARLAELVGPEPFDGFHWCSFGLSPAYEARLTAAGLVVNARSDEAGVEGLELVDHPFYVATLFQPQMGASSGGSLHPLIHACVRAAAARRR